jgi:hypothetical protein
MNVPSKLAFALALALLVSAKASARDRCAGRGAGEHGVRALASPSLSPNSRGQGDVCEAAGPLPQQDHPNLTRYATESYGDHSLDAATIAEQSLGRLALYTMRFQFASGHEQFVTVTAPPGGLQPEMRDMSGDNVANDLVLSSRVLRSPLVVLLNDGQDHLTVAVSPSSFASGEDSASGEQARHHPWAVMSSRVKLAGLGKGGDVLDPHSQEDIHLAIAAIASQSATLSSNPERAPPEFLEQN